MNQPKIERHPFKPFLPVDAKIVMCGTFPPKPDKWSMDFFYPNFYNDMWRIFGEIFYGEKEKFFDPSTKSIDKKGIMEMLERYKIGVGETTLEAVRTKDNASDKFLEIVTPVNLPALLEKVPECIAIVTTGEKAASVIASLTSTAIPKMGEWTDCTVVMPDGSSRKIQHWRLPSTSRAYPMKIEKKTQYYFNMLKTLGIIR